MESAIRDYTKTKGLHRQTVDRWLGWERSDGDALGEIAVSLKISENNLRDMMDWLEEISLRDGTKICEILTRPVISSFRTDPRLGRSDKLKRIKEQIWRWRFPRLAAVEESIRAKIHALKLPPEVRMYVSPGLEGGKLQVHLSAGSVTEFEKLAHSLGDAATTVLVAQIFDLMAGDNMRDDQSQR